ncbi:HAMP domain-containing sensor histidine kinase [Hornefia butyriciproducens]|uniref:sensor histidine kinase n=1 Tax=Hornefia butyriciproducens TaxID=2652293 RepID=UPI002A91B4A6|nr:HAMP domain-containing sensor histidine kinase [Hornefia butyriciproducens]MCI7412527.1 HAMP domain-containing histidine kinase [Clostridiales bacterium]MDY6211648.1 HAMP domain-containing sensor histidine kinase [Hornefia butyriciproducens]
MIKELRKKFVIVTMLLFAIVFTALFAVYCISDYYWNKYNTLYTLGEIAESDSFQETLDDSDIETSGTNPIYAVTVKSDGTVRSIQSSNGKYEKADIAKIVRGISAQDDDTYQWKDYLYYSVSNKDGSSYIVFQDASMQSSDIRRMFKRVFFLLGGLLLLLGVSLYLSRFVTRPAEEMLRREKQFISDASHDLKTPVAAIRINAQVLADQESAGDAPVTAMNIGLPQNTESAGGDMPNAESAAGNTLNANGGTPNAELTGESTLSAESAANPATSNRLSADKARESNRQLVSNILTEAERMSRLISELLSFSYIEEKTLHMDQTLFSLSEGCEEVALSMESTAFEKNISLTYDIGENINYCGDGDALRRVCAILLDNAIEHTPENGDIQMTLRKQGKHPVITVVNTGSPIPKADLPHIFERFYRVEKERNGKTGHFGLGLSIAKTIVEAHHGTITAKNDPGLVTFTVRL